MADAPLYDQIRTREALLSAWLTVKASAENSSSPQIRHAAREFDRGRERHFKTIKDQLRELRYEFSEPVPYLKKRGPGKEPRPIVSATMRDRVVQRALLNIVQTIERVRSYIAHPGSYGGIQGRSVRHAVEQVCCSVTSGASYYVRTDIPDFFRKVPRLRALNELSGLLPDNSLDGLLDRATYNEFVGLEKAVGPYVHLFPTPDEGIAQGCCLSPLLGNVLLHDLDSELNSDGVRCIRYIDDLIILASTRKDARVAFERARAILRDLELDVYPPGHPSGKAKEGPTKTSFEFLGCSINRDFVAPAPDARKRFEERIERRVASACKSLMEERWDAPSGGRDTLLDACMHINRMVYAWAKQYEFCNGRQALESVDRTVDNALRRLLGTYADRRKRLGSDEERRRMFGVALAQDGDCDPILPLPQ